MTKPFVLTLALLGSALLVAPATPAVASDRPLGQPQAVVAATATPDFDGDGKVDYALEHSVGDALSAVVVHYGSGVSQDLSSSVVIGVEDAYTEDPLARDFNADGYTDLALTAGVYGQQGRLFILFGSATGLHVDATHAYPVPGTDATHGTEALAFLAKPVSRLVVGVVPSPAGPTGAVVVYTLGADGLPTGSPATLRPGEGAVPTFTDAGSFGSALATIDNRLFVGASDAKIKGHKWAGAVVSLVFGQAGATSGKLITQATAGVAGSPGTDHWFGHSLAARDGYLAVGTPHDSVGKVKDTGSVQLFTVRSSGVKAVKRISQSSRGVPGKSEQKDSFGWSVELGNVCTGRPAVVVGGRGEVIAKGHENDGSVWVIPLKITSACPARQLWEGHGIGGKPTYSRGLGDHVAVIRAAGERADRILIGGEGDYSEGPNGVFAIWSAQARSALYYEVDMIYGFAGR